MQITITTMKYRNKNYISLVTFFLLLLPIIGLASFLTYCLLDSPLIKPPVFGQVPATHLKPDVNLPITPPEFQTGDEALFNFTGDTVLVLDQQNELSDDEVRILYKSPQSGFQTLDLPDTWLVKIHTDTAATEPPAPLNDKLEQYKKALGN